MVRLALRDFLEVPLRQDEATYRQIRLSVLDDHWCHDVIVTVGFHHSTDAGVLIGN